MTIREHKWVARDVICNYLGAVALIMLMYTLIVWLADVIVEWGVRFVGLSDVVLLSNLSVSEILLQPIFTIGLCSVALTLQSEKKPIIEQLGEGFKYCGKSFWLYYSCRLISLLWGLLFIVPGIIKWYSYSMAPFIMAERPDLSVRDARRLSRELTEEYKLRIFLLDLSFIGWAVAVLIIALMLKSGMILVGLVLTLMLSLWLIPYMMTARADLYRYIKEQKNITELKSIGPRETEKIEEMQQDWPQKHKHNKTVTLIVCISVLLAAAIAAGCIIYQIKETGEVPTIIPGSVAETIDRDVSK